MGGDFSPRIRKWRQVAQQHQRGFVENRLWLPDLMGLDVPMRYKSGQVLVSEKKKEIFKEGRPCRLWVLKWRRAGISAEETAELYAYLFGTANARLGIIAHQDERAQKLLESLKNYHRLLCMKYPELALALSKDNIRGLKIEETDAQILIGTAKNPVKIRGDGLHRVLVTEGAHMFNMFNNVMKEICPVVPPMASSLITVETTGTLRGSEPYFHCMEAKAGKNEFEYMFLCWLKAVEETMKASDILLKTDGKRRDNELFAHQELLELIYDREPRLANKNAHYKLTPGQIAKSWEMFHFQSENDFEYFSREFPYCEEDAWSSGSASYFGNYELTKATPVHPEKQYVIDEHNINRVFDDFSELREVDQLDMYGNKPSIKVWKGPQKGRRYVIGADSSQGEDDGDYGSGYVIDEQTREQMCAYHGRLRPDEAAHVLVSLGRMYNYAVIAPETNHAGGGSECLNMCQRLGYWNIYKWRIRDGKEGVTASNKLGWWTSPTSRVMMLGELRRLFLDCINEKLKLQGTFRDAALIHEMQTFGTDPSTGIPRANNGCYDDRVMACAIAHRVAADETHCTSRDILNQYHEVIREKRKPIEQADLVNRKMDPDKVMRSIMGQHSGFMSNKWEMGDGGNIC